jgi:hypothetical protein
VFQDGNGNGVMDGDESPVGGAGVLVTSASWYGFTRTSADGYYSLGGIAGGSYSVNLIVGPEWGHTTAQAIAGVAVTGQADSKGVADFGLRR